MSDFGSGLPVLHTSVPGPASLELARRLRAVESQNVTFMGDRFPVFWDEASGTNVRDADGNEFLDLTGAFGVALAGHGNALVTARIEVQAEHLVHGMGDVHPPAVKVGLLERIASYAPWPDAKTVLTGSGSEAVEVALKTGAIASGRPGVLAFDGAYHGLTLGALAVTHRRHFRAPFDERLFGGVSFAPFPTRVEDTDRALEFVARSLERGAPDGSAIGTVIVEPIQGRAGARIPAEGFLRAMTALARKAGCVVVMDEVLTGFGRTGEMFASVSEGAGPDILCVGKALGGGLPIGACIAASGVMDAWPPSTGEAIHTSTFMAHPLSVAGALGFLDELDEGALVARVRDDGTELLALLRDAVRGHPLVADVRGRGLLLAVELQGPDGSPLAGGGAKVAEAALQSGLIVLPAGGVGEVVELTPPVGLTAEQTSWAVQQLSDCLAMISTQA